MHSRDKTRKKITYDFDAVKWLTLLKLNVWERDLLKYIAYIEH